MEYKKVKQQLIRGMGLASLLAILAACGDVGANPPPQTNDSSYLLTVKISSSDTAQSLAQKYGGETLLWDAEGGQAVLKMSAEAAAQFRASGISMQGTTLESNTSTIAPEASASGWDVWAGGWNAWAGGWNAWAGGWNAWAGGTSTIPAIPAENRHAWTRVGLPQAFAVSKNFGAGMTVAVIDTGIDFNHPIFSGRLAPSSQWKDFVDGDAYPQEVAGGSGYGHGTAVAGIILQVAPKAKILPIRVLRPDGTADVGSVASAINWAVQQNARIINLSLGTDVNVTALQTAINYATSMNIFVVASAGNEGSTNITYPAAYATTGTNARYLISVGSASANSLMSAFSNRSTALEVTAPGEGLYTAYPGNQVAAVTGTSFAAPVVSGALALGAYETDISNTWNLEAHLLSGSWTMNSGGQHMNIHAMRLWQPDFQRWRKALFVVGSTALSPADQAAYDRLYGYLGYNVTVKTGAAALSSDASGMDLVVVSSTVNPNDVNTKFRNVAVPVMVWESQLFDDMGMTSSLSTDLGNTTSQSSMNIVGNTHPLGAGLAAASNSISGSVTLSWGKPSSSAIKIASLTSDATRSTIFAYNSGSSMVGLNAPARRVGFMLHDTTATRLTDTWWMSWLFDAAVTWATTGN